MTDTLGEHWNIHGDPYRFEQFDTYTPPAPVPPVDLVEWFWKFTSQFSEKEQ